MVTTTRLVLVPGLVCDAELWKHQTDTLGDICEPAIFDMAPYDDMGAAARALLETFPGKFALAGLSMGGYLAFEIMRQAPERVSKLALLDTTPAADSPESIERRKGGIEQAKSGNFKKVMEGYLPFFMHEKRLADPEFVKKVVAMTDRVGRDSFINGQTLMMNRSDSRASLGAIACPTLVLCGRQDTLTPLAVHVDMAAQIPGASLVVVEDSGHLSTMEQPHAVSAVMRYWLVRD